MNIEIFVCINITISGSAITDSVGISFCLSSVFLGDQWLWDLLGSC